MKTKVKFYFGIALIVVGLAITIFSFTSFGGIVMGRIAAIFLGVGIVLIVDVMWFSR